MPDPALLLSRLDAIAASLREDADACALLALGSVGLETDRLDEHSDLDFFVIVARGAKPRFLHDTAWLERAHPVAFSFPNTPDGRKALFDDGVFAEYAVFEPEELRHIPYAPGRFVWRRESVEADLATPGGASRDDPDAGGRTVEWLVGEALTNLVVGLHRDLRGEVLSATRFVQGYAVDRVLDIAAAILAPAGPPGDRFSPERRFEARFPGVAVALPGMLRGYGRNAESALGVLAWLEAHVPVDARLAREVRALCGEAVKE